MRKLILPAGLVVTAVVAVTPALAATKSVTATKDNRWTPSAISVKKGDKITFRWNNTGAPHDVQKTSGKGGSLTANRISNKGSATFSVPSSAKKGAKWTFICTVHAGTMKLTATVR